MNEETLGMIIGFVIVAPIAAFVTYRYLKRRRDDEGDGRR